MDLKEIKESDHSWWLSYLEKNTHFDYKRIKEQIDWLIEQAGKAERYEKALKEIAESDDDDSSCNELALKYEVIAEKALNS